MVGDSERSSCSYVSYDGSTSSSNSDCDVPSTAVREGQRRRKKRKSYKEPPCQYRKDISQPDTSEECSGGISSDGSYSYSSQGSQGLNHSWSSVSAPPTPFGMQSTLSPCHSPTNVESQNPRSVPPESDDDDPFNRQYFEKLCPCTDVTAGDVIFMTLALGCRHGLTWAAQNDILRAFQSISGKRFPQKIQSLFKNFENYEGNVKFHMFCHVCDKYLGPRDELLDGNCSNEECKANLKMKSSQNYFLSLSMKSQLLSYLKDKNFIEMVLKYRFQKPTCDGVYSDIYGGSVYRKYFDNGGILSNPYNFSYSYFLDGLAYGDSSTQSVWPIYVTINELPYGQRSKYLILAGLYVGKKEPNFENILEPFVTEANELSEHGVQWLQDGEPVTSHLIPLCCIADSGARHKILNMKKFNAYHGCTFCYKRAENTRKGIRYPIGEIAPLRSNESIRGDLKEVLERMNMPGVKDKSHRGVNGLTPLMHLSNFNFECSVVVDYMHNILLGTTKHHMELLLASERKDKFWVGMNDRMGMEHLKCIIDKRISRLQSNSSVIRDPRPLTDIATWRASEWRAWLLFYMFPSLQDLLKEKHLRHLAMLSSSTYILLKKSITSEEINAAHKLLMLYSFYFQKYFGPEEMRYNVHLLSHVAEGVQNFGPLWTHNAFMYEAQNRYLRKLSKCPSSIILEMAKKFIVFRSLPQLQSKLVKSKKTIEFCSEIENSSRLKKCLQSEDGFVLLGGGDLCALTEDEQTILTEYANVSQYYKCYQRILCGSTKYCTAVYSKGKKNDDSCALLSDGRYVSVNHILLLMDGSIAIIVEVLNISNTAEWFQISWQILITSNSMKILENFSA
ncbi:uncharacterized protein LOC124160594 [Ischnura elegans]|uniref:uncharacterized protein LOC124160594 n=1 Tax=Ischnura elegans TaxID=197161 RepID=UPI001ED8B8F3|nr:uncharacterized protein LOC124160594 [Ischnura elegans]